MLLTVLGGTANRSVQRRSLKGELGQIHHRLNDCIIIDHENEGELVEASSSSLHGRFRLTCRFGVSRQIVQSFRCVHTSRLSDGYGTGPTRSHSTDKLVLDDVREVNDTLWRYQRADEEDAQAVKAASLWSTRSRRRSGESRDLKTDRLDHFVKERGQYVTRALEVREKPAVILGSSVTDSPDSQISAVRKESRFTRT